jgi:hypothetical protein
MINQTRVSSARHALFAQQASYIFGAAARVAEPSRSVEHTKITRSRAERVLIVGSTSPLQFRHTHLNGDARNTVHRGRIEMLRRVQFNLLVASAEAGRPEQRLGVK